MHLVSTAVVRLVRALGHRTARLLSMFVAARTEPMGKQWSADAPRRFVDKVLKRRSSERRRAEQADRTTVRGEPPRGQTCRIRASSRSRQGRSRTPTRREPPNFPHHLGPAACRRLPVVVTVPTHPMFFSRRFLGGVVGWVPRYTACG
jgi:hypothetical protein